MVLCLRSGQVTMAVQHGIQPWQHGHAPTRALKLMPTASQISPGRAEFYSPSYVNLAI